MKKTIQTTLLFAAILAVLLGLATVVERAAGAKELPAESEEAEETVVYNELNEDGAAVITLSGDTATVAGLGAQVAGNVVTVKYPGTYRVEGTLRGQLVVDLGEYSGAAYIILNGADIACADGPALYIAQADRTTVLLADGTQNALTDGEDYALLINGEYHTGAALYSSDDLVIEGGGALTVTGNAADGIRAKDALRIASGSLSITGTDDGIRVNDDLTIEGGALLIGAGGDGVSVSRGGLAVSGGYLWINSTGDALTAAGTLTVTGGTVNATTCGGSLMYSYVALNDLSAKGMKAAAITVTGGTIDLDTADDAIHAAGDLSITGGSFALASGDDAIHADGLMDIRNVAIDVTACYEGLEAESVRVGNIWLRVAAENNGVDAGTEGFVMEDGTLILTAPCGIGSEGALTVSGGTVTVTADGTDAPFKFTAAQAAGAISAYCAAGTAETLLEKGELPGSLLFVLPSDVSAGTAVTLYSPAGEALYQTTTTTYGGAFLYAGDPLVIGQTYTLTAGDYVFSAALTEGCTVTQPQQTAQQTAAQTNASPSGMASGG